MIHGASPPPTSQHTHTSYLEEASITPVHMLQKIQYVFFVYNCKEDLEVKKHIIIIIKMDTLVT